MPRRRYTDEERANAIAALAANGGNVNHTARQLGIPAKTLENWAKGTTHPESAEQGEEKKAELADRLEGIAHQLLDSAPGKIADANLSQTFVAFGIAVEKMRLLRDQPTSIEGDRLTDEQRIGRINALLDAARARRNGHAANGSTDKVLPRQSEPPHEGGRNGAGPVADGPPPLDL